MFLALLSKPRLQKAGTWPTWNPPDLLQHKFISLRSDVKAKQENWNLCIIYISSEYYTFSSMTETRSGDYYQNRTKQMQKRMDQTTKQIGELHPKNEDKQDLSVFLGKAHIHILEFGVSSFKFQHLLNIRPSIILSWISNEEAIATSINKDFFLCATFSQNPWQAQVANAPPSWAMESHCSARKSYRETRSTIPRKHKATLHSLDVIQSHTQTQILQHLFPNTKAAAKASVQFQYYKNLCTHCQQSTWQKDSKQITLNYHPQQLLLNTTHESKRNCKTPFPHFRSIKQEAEQSRQKEFRAGQRQGVLREWITNFGNTTLSK